MSYQVSARKYRPQQFAEVVGQPHIVRTLSNAIESGRIAHAYLFSGIRGVGKTTIARIFAKALNCESGPTITPCGQCDACAAVTRGDAADVMEIDGASNNSVDNVRELSDNIRYRPLAARYKVYIIDEVHMLSTQAFNALLKTLEEPPDHAVFLFATTETHKIPQTILSRCQHHAFRRVSREEISSHLTALAAHGNIEADRTAIGQLARAADGSLRDSLSLFDQAVSFGGGKVTEQDVTLMLGTVGQPTLVALAEEVLSGDASAVLARLAHLSDAGQDLTILAAELVEHFRNLLLCRVSREPHRLIDLADDDVAELITQAQATPREVLEQVLSLLTDAHERCRRATTPRYLLEAALVRACSAYELEDLSQVLARLNELSGHAEAPKRTPRPESLRPAPPGGHGPQRKTDSAPEVPIPQASTAGERGAEQARPPAPLKAMEAVQATPIPEPAPVPEAPMPQAVPAPAPSKTMEAGASTPTPRQVVPTAQDEPPEPAPPEVPFEPSTPDIPLEPVVPDEPEAPEVPEPTPERPEPTPPERPFPSAGAHAWPAAPPRAMEAGAAPAVNARGGQDAGESAHAPQRAVPTPADDMAYAGYGDEGDDPALYLDPPPARPAPQSAAPASTPPRPPAVDAPGNAQAAQPARLSQQAAPPTPPPDRATPRAPAVDASSYPQADEPARLPQQAAPPTPPPDRSTPRAPAVDAPGNPQASESARLPQQAVPAPVDEAALKQSWEQVMERIRTLRPALASYLEQGVFKAAGPDQVVIGYLPAYEVMMSMVDRAENKSFIGKLAGDVLGRPLGVAFAAINDPGDDVTTLAQEFEAKEQEAHRAEVQRTMEIPFVKDVMDEFGGTVVELHKPE